MTNIKNIAIIGAGPSGISAYLQLVKELHNDLTSITIFDPIGIAESFSFNTDLASSLNNTSVGVSSLYSDDKLDYFKWLQDKKSDLNVSSSDFISRYYFKEYCQDRFWQSKDYADAFGCSTFVENSEVHKLAFKNGRMIVTSQNDIDFFFNAVILATGVTTTTPGGLDNSCTNLITNPYPESLFLQRVNNDSKVLILGSKLSAIDVSVAIHNKYPNAQMTMVSRSGELPSVRSSLLIKSTVPQDYNSLSRLSASSCADKINAEYKLEQDIACCKSSLNHWEDIVGQFIEEFNEQIPTMTPDRQLRLMSKYQYFIKHYVSSFPLANAEIVLQAIKSGNLTILKKDISDYIVVKDKHIFGKERDRLKNFDVVINASGISHKPIDDTLIHSLSQLSVTKNKAGGLKVSSSSMRVLSENDSVPLYVIGGPAAGEVPITNYVRSSVTQAKKIVSDIVRLTRCSKKGLLSYYA
ncbi:FAD/NAD(P)-binding protein [Photobacterium sp. TLY01]|uniref:FAD/NAD(P)-binding protein n=1 Tax=Photobacterium sp. TLY01 TaxID=2907534 RepID=UPI001F2868EC|nr:FAD/NAD(P)-binding protein [Photobacterium sp. TLY01]UIP30699.1 FAD/NAD(P)-binding protein [Photobacterium sp. TLY01]